MIEAGALLTSYTTTDTQTIPLICNHQIVKSSTFAGCEWLG